MLARNSECIIGFHPYSDSVRKQSLRDLHSRAPDHSGSNEPEGAHCVAEMISGLKNVRLIAEKMVGNP